MTLLGTHWLCTDMVVPLSVLVTLAIAYFTILPLVYWRRRGVPSMFAVPVLGSLTKAAFLQKSIGEVYTDMYNKTSGKRYLGFLKFTQPAVLLRDPEIIKNALNRDFVHFHANDVHVDETVDPVFGKHVFSLNGERWKKLRAVLSPGFTSGRMKAMFPIVCEACDNLRDHLVGCVDSSGDSGVPVEMKDVCARYTTEVVSSIAFGLRCEALKNPNTEFRQMGRKILEPSTSKALMNLVFLFLPGLNKLLRIPFVPEEVINFFRNIVLSVITKREDEGTARDDYIQFFTQLWKEGKLKPDYHLQEQGAQSSGKELVDGEVSVHSLRNNLSELDDITAQAVGFFIDGFETSSVLISFTFFELAHKQEVQQKLRKNIEDAMLRHGGTLTYEALQDVPYLEMVIQETLRLYPPAPFMSRICMKRYLLPNPEEGVSGGVWLEEGTPAIFPVYALQHDSQYFPNPEVFDPERFTSEAKRNRQQCTYMPFGEGPRICIGMRFGVLQTKVAVANVILRFQISPHEKTIRPITLDPNTILTSSKHGLWVNIKHLKAKRS